MRLSIKYAKLAVANSRPNNGMKKTKLNGDSKCSQQADYAGELVFHFLSKVRSLFIIIICIYIYFLN